MRKIADRQQRAKERTELLRSDSGLDTGQPQPLPPVGVRHARTSSTVSNSSTAAGGGGGGHCRAPSLSTRSTHQRSPSTALAATTTTTAVTASGPNTAPSAPLTVASELPPTRELPATGGDADLHPEQTESTTSADVVHSNSQPATSSAAAAAAIASNAPSSDSLASAAPVAVQNPSS